MEAVSPGDAAPWRLPVHPVQLWVAGVHARSHPPPDSFVFYRPHMSVSCVRRLTPEPWKLWRQFFQVMRTCFLRALPASEEKRSMVIQQDVGKQNASLTVCSEDGELSCDKLFWTGSEAFALRYFHASFLFKGCRGNTGYWVFMLSGLSLLLSPPVWTI